MGKLWIVTAGTALALALPAPALAFVRSGPAADPGKPFFDARADAPAPSAVAVPGTLPGGSAGTRRAQRSSGALTAPSAGSRSSVARSYLDAHRAALGLGAGLDAPSTVAGPSGIASLRFRQSYRGIPAFDADVRVGLDRANRVLSVDSSAVGQLQVDSVAPAISAAQAVAKVSGTSAPAVTSGPAGARRATQFAGGGDAQLTIFTGAGAPKLAWHVTVPQPPALYDAVVDAQTGALLYRQNLTKYDTNGDVWPFAPTTPARTTVSLTPWLDSPLPATLQGPFVHPYSDLNDDDTAQASETVAPVGGNYQFPFTPGAATGGCLATGPLCSWTRTTPTIDSWRVNREQNVVQAFYLANVFHDHVNAAPIGFDDSTGFAGDDPLLLETDDGADTDTNPATGPDAKHINNANMSTPVNGKSPRMQMYLFGGSGFRNVNGGDDAAVLWHEYTHGLSNRLVTNADGSGSLSSPVAGALGEAWSDWYALDFLVDQGAYTDTAASGEVDLGRYTDATPHALRSEPIDCAVGASAAVCPGGRNTGAGGYTLGDFGKVSTGPEVHADGEIWGQTLWDIRTALGSSLAEQVVTDGMRLSAPSPSYLDMRNAILAAAANDAPGQVNTLWQLFAARGMGYYASQSDSSDVNPVEDFSLPPSGGDTGTLTGRVTDALTGLPLAGIRVSPASLATPLKSGSTNAPAATTGADGRYTLTLPVGHYPQIAFLGAGGYDRVLTSDITITAGQSVTRDASTAKDWAAPAAGATITGNDDSGKDFGCGVGQLVDQTQGAGWSAYNSVSTDPENPHPGLPPAATIDLGRTIDIDHFGFDPSANCLDDDSAMTRSYAIETSADGVTYHQAKVGTFDSTNNRKLNVVTPDANASGVRFVRVTLLAPQRTTAGQSGADFVDASEFEVYGGPANARPSGSLTATPNTLAPGGSVAFDASSFSDPDSLISGYGWDFDGDGTIDQTTPGPATTHVYPTAGTFTAKVTVHDTRGAGKDDGSATATVAVGVPVTATPSPTAAPTPPPGSYPLPTAKPVVTIARSGRKGALTVQVTCALRCKVSGTLTASSTDKRKLKLRLRRIRTLTKTITSTKRQTLTIKLSKAATTALKRRRRTQLRPVAQFTATYTADRRATKARRTVNLKR